MLREIYFLAICLMAAPIASESAAEVKIAILDSGCNIEYEEGISFVDDTTIDLNGHGTAIAKIIKRINPNAKLYVAKVFNQNGRNLDATPFVRGIHWAISHQVDLINFSWQIHKDQKSIHNAIQEAYHQGIIMVAAAGNRDALLDVLVAELNSHSQKRGISTGVKYPAKYREVIAIGATKSLWWLDRHERYSPTGAEIEFVCDGSYSSQKGTSFAAARAAAIVSKIKTDHPDLGGARLRAMLRLYARDLGDKGKDAKFGYGKLEYRSSEMVRIMS